jgi:hypothetical protein
VNPDLINPDPQPCSNVWLLFLFLFLVLFFRQPKVQPQEQRKKRRLCPGADSKTCTRFQSRFYIVMITEVLYKIKSWTEETDCRRQNNSNLQLGKITFVKKNLQILYISIIVADQVCFIPDPDY